MEMKKAHWATEGDNVTLSMPLTKVDKENRLVSGWASLDNADTQGDVVLAEASSKAFSRFRGNIREMHQPIAVGKMVEFKEDSYYDVKSQKFYNGIYATVYVSKGAQDTWEKVLDGTLTGFSIGGSIIDSETQFVKDAGRSIRFVKDYELVELSLVDSPANELANVFSITKMAGGEKIMKGMVADTKSETVFYCSEDGVAKTSSEETVDCGNCGKKMENIGWFEYDDATDKTVKMAELVDNYRQAKQELPATNEGGVNVAEEDKKDETVVEGGAAPEVVDAGEAGKAQTEVDSSTESLAEGEDKAADNAEVADSDEEVTKAADVSEVEVEEPDFARLTKMLEDMTGTINAGFTKSVDESKAIIEEATKSFEGKITELSAKYDELTTKFDSLRDEVNNVEKRVDGVEDETAVKKSGDLGGSKEDTLRKSKSESKWGGHFLGVSTTLQ